MAFMTFGVAPMAQKPGNGHGCPGRTTVSGSTMLSQTMRLSSMRAQAVFTITALVRTAGPITARLSFGLQGKAERAGPMGQVMEIPCQKIPTMSAYSSAYSSGAVNVIDGLATQCRAVARLCGIRAHPTRTWRISLHRCGQCCLGR